jgi:hypothetical protein
MISTVDLLVLTSLDHLLFIVKLYFFLFYKTTYLNEEVNRTEPSPSVRVPWICHLFFLPAQGASTFDIFGAKAEQL